MEAGKTDSRGYLLRGGLHVGTLEVSRVERRLLIGRLDELRMAN